MNQGTTSSFTDSGKWSKIALAIGLMVLAGLLGAGCGSSDSAGEQSENPGTSNEEPVVQVWSEEELGEFVLDQRELMANDLATFCDETNEGFNQVYRGPEKEPLDSTNWKSVCSGSPEGVATGQVPADVRNELLSGEVESVQIDDNEKSAVVTLTSTAPNPTHYVLDASKPDASGKVEWSLSGWTEPDHRAYYKSPDSLNAIDVVDGFLDAVASANFDKACGLMGEGRSKDIPKSLIETGYFEEYCGIGVDRPEAFSKIDIDIDGLREDKAIAYLGGESEKFQMSGNEMERWNATPADFSVEVAMGTLDFTQRVATPGSTLSTFTTEAARFDLFMPYQGADDWKILSWSAS